MRWKGLRSTFAFVVFVFCIFMGGKIFQTENYRIFSEYLFYAFLVYIGRKGIYMMRDVFSKEKKK